MARQHHPAAAFNPAIPRPLAVRVISSIALLLLPILTVISFSFTLKTIYTPAFALSHPVADGGFDPDGNPLPAILNFNLTYKRAPFYICGPDIGTYNNATAFNQTCTRIHGLGAKGMDECFVAFPRDEQLCQKVVASASLYVAAAVLIGLALPCAITVAGLSFRSASAAAWSPAYSALPSTASKQHHDNGDGEALNASNAGETSTSTSASASAAATSPSSPQNLAASILQVVAILFLVLGAVCLVFAQILGVQSLVNEQRPTASELDTALSRWFMGPAAYVYTSVAYLAAGLAAFAAASGCGVKGR
jgi:hypothetical protein